MKRRMKYTEAPMGKLKRVKDFLPPLDQLVLKEEIVKDTSTLSKENLAGDSKKDRKRNRDDVWG
jgi:hypothetical protein